MLEKTLIDKLLMKPGRKIYVSNAPQDYLDQFNKLPDYANLDKPPK